SLTDVASSSRTRRSWHRQPMASPCTAPRSLSRATW
ncbi:unnamed protein product, partial [Tetraodon nigroviridis]